MPAWSLYQAFTGFVSSNVWTYDCSFFQEWLLAALDNTSGYIYDHSLDFRLALLQSSLHIQTFVSGPQPRLIDEASKADKHAQHYPSGHFHRRFSWLYILDYSTRKWKRRQWKYIVDRHDESAFSSFSNVYQPVVNAVHPQKLKVARADGYLR